MAQVVDCLSSKYKELSSNPSTTAKKKNLYPNCAPPPGWRVRDGLSEEGVFEVDFHFIPLILLLHHIPFLSPKAATHSKYMRICLCACAAVMQNAYCYFVYHM
jgi:hypothetical protein